MPFPNEHAARIKQPGQFNEFRRENDRLDSGIHAIFGITGTGKNRRSEIQAIRFDKDKFTPAQARRWLKEHDFKAIEFEPAEKQTGTSNLIHGQGSMFGEVSGLGGEKMPWFIEKREDEFCVVKGTKENPIETEKCHATREAANAQMRALYTAEEKQVDDTEKAVWTRAYINNLPDGAFLYIAPGGEKDDEGKTKPRTLRKFPYKNAEGGIDLPHLRNAIARIPQSNAPGLDDAKKRSLQARARRILEDASKKQVDEFESSFFVYKSASGEMRWVSVSSTAVKDKEFEIVTEQAYDDAIQHAKNTDDFGELDLVHVDGTDVGDADLMVRVGKRLIEGGTFRDTQMAANAIKAVQDDPNFWGTSIQFVFDPSKFDGESYTGNIRILKRAILPQEMAASFGTKFVAIGGRTIMEELKQDTKEALAELGVSEEEIEALAEKQDAQQENVKAKEAEEPVTEKKTVWERFTDFLAQFEKEPSIEPGDAETTQEATPTPETAKAQVTLDEETIKAMAQTIATATAEKLAEQSEQIEMLSKAISDFDARLKQAEEAVEDKVLSRLADLPQIVKVRATETDVTVVEDTEPKSPLPQQGFDTSTYIEEMVKGVTDAVSQALVPVTKVKV